MENGWQVNLALAFAIYILQLFTVAAQRHWDPLLASGFWYTPESIYYQSLLFLATTLIAAIMTTVPPAYLASLKSNIRARTIPWEGALRAGDITEDQYTRIDKVKGQQSERRKELVAEDLDGFKTLFAGDSENGKPGVFESARKNAKLLQYLLVLMADLVEGKQKKRDLYTARQHV